MELATNGNIFRMNGQLQRIETSRRFSFALLISCALHALALFFFYLGTSGDEESNQRMDAEHRAAPLIAHLPGKPVDTIHSAHLEPMTSAGTPERTKRAADAAPSSGAAPAEGINLLPIGGAEYFATDQLTRRPQPLALTELETPEIKPIVASGTMILKLWINARGEVAAVDVESSTLPAVFSRTAVAAFRSSRFQPGERNGLPVGTVMRIEVSYDDGRVPAPDVPGSNSPIPWAAEKP